MRTSVSKVLAKIPTIGGLTDYLISDRVQGMSEITIYCEDCEVEFEAEAQYLGRDEDGLDVYDIDEAVKEARFILGVDHYGHDTSLVRW